MALRLILTTEEKALVTEALTQYAMPIMNKQKKTHEEKRKLSEIENIIMQINCGKEIP